MTHSGGRSHFALLGLPERFALDPEALERAFHEMSRLVHPDRFAGAPPAERRLAVQRSTELNDAYRTLKDPMRRAEYLLARAGRARSETAGTRDPELLQEVLEGRERVAELKERLLHGAPGALDELAMLRAETDEKVRAAMAAIERAFAAWDAGDARAADAVASAVDRNKYYLGIQTELAELALRAGQLV